jgi:hypothetical protein
MKVRILQALAVYVEDELVAPKVGSVVELGDNLALVYVEAGLAEFVEEFEPVKTETETETETATAETAATADESAASEAEAAATVDETASTEAETASNGDEVDETEATEQQEFVGPSANPSPADLAAAKRGRKG